MKLSLALAILGQTVSTLSQRNGPVTARDGGLGLNDAKLQKATSPQSLILEHNDKQRGLRRYNRRLMHDQMARNLKNSPGFRKAMVPCDPRSTDADVGILSCGPDYICEPSSTSSLGGVCAPLEYQDFERDSFLRWKRPRMKNQHPAAATTGNARVQCNPTWPDIGILACEEGQYCMDDETSGLGGFCVDTSTTSNSRRLQAYPLDDYLYLCGAYPPDAPFMFCDCSRLDSAAGAGTMYCSQNNTADYVEGCDAYTVYDFFTYSFSDSVLVKFTDCYETTKPIKEEICFFYDFEGQDSVCSTEWNGQSCNSCVIIDAYTAGFDCSNLDGGRVGNSLNDRLAIFDLCLNPPICNTVCGEGSYIPDFNFDTNITIGGTNSTCGYLADREESATLVGAYCPLYVEAAQNYCCVSLNATIPGDNVTSSQVAGNEGVPARMLRAWHP